MLNKFFFIIIFLNLVFLLNIQFVKADETGCCVFGTPGPIDIQEDFRGNSRGEGYTDCENVVKDDCKPTILKGKATFFAGKECKNIPKASFHQWQCKDKEPEPEEPEKKPKTPSGRKLADVSGNFPNPFNTMDVSEIIGRIIKAILSIVGSIALIMFIYGGIIWMTASGNDERVKKGGQILTWAAVGLVVIFAAYGIVSRILNIIT